MTICCSIFTVEFLNLLLVILYRLALDYVLYQAELSPNLSYFQNLVGREGFEPPTTAL